MIDRCPTCGTPLRAGACRRCAGRVERPELIAPPRRGGPIGEFLLGLRLALRGARITVGTPSLFVLWILPVILGLSLFGGLVYYGITHRAMFLPSFEDAWPGWIDWARAPLQGVAGFLGGVLGVILAAASTLLLSSVISAPILEWMSETVESIVLGVKDERPIDAHYVWNIWIVPLLQAAVVAAVQGALFVVLLVMSLTGVLAPVALACSAWVTSVTLTDVVIARKRYPISARFRLPSRNLALWIGLALPFALAPYLLSLGVAGATLAYLREKQLAGSRAT